LVQRRRIEAELAGEHVAAGIGNQLRCDGDGGIFVLKVDGKGEFLGDVQRLKLKRAPRLTQGALEVSQLTQDEAQVVVRRREILVCVHGLPERVARLLVTFELHQNQTDAVPPVGAGRLFPEGALILFERGLVLTALKQQQRQIEAGGQEWLLTFERLPKRVGRRFAGTLARSNDTDVVPCQPVPGVGGNRFLVGRQGVSASSCLVQTHPTLVPQLG